MRSDSRLAFRVGLVASTTASLGFAQNSPSLDLRQAEPPTDPRGSIYLEPTATPGPGAWNVGARFAYSYRSVTLRDAQDEVVSVPLAHQLSVDYLASVGVGQRLGVGLALPTVLYQSGDNLRALGEISPLPKTAVGDVAMIAKGTLLSPSEGIGLAALGRMTLPTGNRRSYLGEGAVTGEFRMLGELDLQAAALRATAGIRLRAYERTYVGETFGHDLPWGLGLVLRPQALGWTERARWEWYAEVHGRVAITPEFASMPESPVLGALGASYSLGDLSLFAGVEAPFNAAIGNPRVRGMLGVGWAPRFYDADQDGVADEIDQCVEIPEDRDGFEDTDGCPDVDHDNDGVLDPDDRCPRDAEDADGFQDQDGCPDPDNDRDGVLDAADACPDVPGGTGSEKPGCPAMDSDRDGVPDPADRCPSEAEDQDGHEDTDGCPDPDNDADGLSDQDDACPDAAGPLRSDPTLSGCPNPDRDHDTFVDDLDQCPDLPEDFEGDRDEDGCPDQPVGKARAANKPPLVSFERRGRDSVVRFTSPLVLRAEQDRIVLDPASLPSVRALAARLAAEPATVVLVGARPANTSVEALALAQRKAYALVELLRSLAHRDDAAEPVAFVLVAVAPGARASGVGMLLVTPKPPDQAPPARTAKP